ncbi:hypothetical protein OsI_01828 [Oryza sativa Indica Group]|uniref:Uncharacterized protein n=1 Tax=Oryza sativa subsp. indica TaxID=39946 RepID=A2WPP7_ORYSI|nr:hypothetical protein OsI_01828 [Oryza sativa Indica Group]
MAKFGQPKLPCHSWARCWRCFSLTPYHLLKSAPTPSAQLPPATAATNGDGAQAAEDGGDEPGWQRMAAEPEQRWTRRRTQVSPPITVVPFLPPLVLAAAMGRRRVVARSHPPPELAVNGSPALKIGGNGTSASHLPEERIPASLLPALHLLPTPVLPLSTSLCRRMCPSHIHLHPRPSSAACHLLLPCHGKVGKEKK